jgi:hypothetical protein
MAVANPTSTNCAFAASPGESTELLDDFAAASYPVSPLHLLAIQAEQRSYGVFLLPFFYVHSRFTADADYCDCLVSLRNDLCWVINNACPQSYC